MHVSFRSAFNRSSGHCISKGSLPSQATIHPMDSLHRVLYRSNNHPCSMQYQIFNRCLFTRIHSEGKTLTVPGLYADRHVLHRRRCLDHYRDAQVQANSLLRNAL